MHVTMFGPQRLQKRTISAMSGAAAGVVGGMLCREDLPMPCSDVEEAVLLEPWPRLLMPQVAQKSLLMNLNIVALRCSRPVVANLRVWVLLCEVLWRGRQIRLLDARDWHLPSCASRTLRFTLIVVLNAISGRDESDAVSKRP